MRMPTFTMAVFTGFQSRSAIFLPPKSFLLPANPVFGAFIQHDNDKKMIAAEKGQNGAKSHTTAHI
jgi:hypothetical protein